MSVRGAVVMLLGGACVVTGLWREDLGLVTVGAGLLGAPGFVRSVNKGEEK